MLLAQQSNALSLDTIFWFTLLAIFIITILTALLRRLSKDKALKLFNEYHITFFSERRPSLWGDCYVSSQGIELLFDQPFTTRRGLIKSSALVYEDEFGPMIALTRTVHGLTRRELRDRQRQIRRTLRPGIIRRFRRWLRTLLNTLRDAITKTMSVIIGRFTATPGNVAGAALASQTNDISNLTGTVVNLAANAYEPLLERFIGHPVVVEISLPPPERWQPPNPPPPPNWIPETAEFPGYLVDYTQKFIAVFNEDHTPIETLTITLEPGKPPAVEIPGFKILVLESDLLLKVDGKDAFVLRSLCCNEQTSDLGIAMIPGTTLILAAPSATATLIVERTRQIDLIVPRTRARIRFGSMSRKERRARNDWLGIAPLVESRIQHLRHTLFSDSTKDDD